ncbi:MAG: hypothetical protein BWY81_00029 [Firmicutes bacterium ADurb.Bin467]|nr:MAG: hypothetical protein BWY81_00029 [Firmicutes bacterium ADurb.Bin467]
MPPAHLDVALDRDPDRGELARPRNHAPEQLAVNVGGLDRDLEVDRSSDGGFSRRVPAAFMRQPATSFPSRRSMPTTAVLTQPAKRRRDIPPHNCITTTRSAQRFFRGVRANGGGTEDRPAGPPAAARRTRGPRFCRISRHSLNNMRIWLRISLSHATLRLFCYELLTGRRRYGILVLLMICSLISDRRAQTGGSHEQKGTRHGSRARRAARPRPLRILAAFSGRMRGRQGLGGHPYGLLRAHGDGPVQGDERKPAPAGYVDQNGGGLEPRKAV